MPFYNDERLRRIRVGIDSYTNNELALDVIGNTNIFADGGLGINTTNTEGVGLYVNGDGFFTGVVTARTFFAGPTEITGGAFADDLTVSTLKVNGISTLGGNNIGAGETSVFIKQNANVEADLYVGDELYVETSVGIGTTNPEQIALYVDGDGYFTGVVTATTFFAGPTEITGGAFADDLTVNTLEVTGVTTIGTGFTVGVGTTSIFIKKSANVEDNLYVGADLYVAGVSTFVGVSSFKSDVTIEGDLYINQVVGTGGTIAFTDTANNVLGDVDTGAVQIDGGLGVAKNTSIGQSLWVGENIGIGSTQPIATLDVDGTLNVTGVSTFTDTTENTLGNVDTGAVQIDGGLGVAKNVSIGGSFYVQGQSEFIGVVTFRGGTINIGDQNTDDINVGGEFVSSLVPNDDDTYDLGSPTQEWRNLYVDGLAEIDDLNVSGLSTFGSNVDINASVDILNDLTVDGLSDLDELNVAGIATFGSDLDVNASIDVSNNLTVDGLSDLDELNVSGLSTFASDLDVNASVDISTNLTVDGLSDLDELNVAGISTFASDLDVNASVDISNNLVVDGLSDLDELNVAGISTFASDLDVNASVDISTNLTVDGLSDLDELNVAGLSTFASDVDINASVDISNDLVLNGNLNVSGVSTFQDDVNIGVGGTTAFFDVSTGYVGIGSTQPGSTLVVDAPSGYTGNVLDLKVGGSPIWQIDEQGNLDLDSGDASNIRFRFDQLYLGSSTSGLNISADNNNDYVTRIRGDKAYGWTNTNNTYQSFAAGLFSDGDNIVSQRLGVGAGQTFRVYNTYTSLTDFERANIGWTTNTFIVGTEKGSAGGTDRQLELHTDGTARVAITTTGNVGIASTQPTARLDVVGQTELDDLNVSGLSTFASNVDINASVDISQTLNVTGVATFGNNVDITGDLTVNGTQTILNTQILEVEDINIGIASADPKLSDTALDGAGLTIHGADGDKTLTWSNADSRMEFNTTLYAPKLEAGLLDVTGVSTFGGNVDINADLDVSGDAVIAGILTVGSASVVIDGDNNSITVGTGASIYTPLDNILTFGTLDLERVRIDDGGNVGIGTTNAVGIADTNNTTILNAGIVTANFFFGSGAGLFDIFADAKGPDGAIQYNNETNIDGATNFFYNDTTNRVGIGTSLPTTDFEVDGNINVTGLSTFNNIDVTGVSTFQSNLIVDSNLGVGTDNPVGLADTNNTSIINTGIVTANFFYGSGAGLFDIFADAKGEDGAIQYNNATNIDGAADFFYDDVNLRVGIGSTVPTVKLDVDGDTNITGIVTAQEFVGIGSQLTNITFRQLSDVDGSNLVAGPGISSTPDYLVIYDPLLDAFRFVDPKSYFGINNDFNPDPIIVDYGSY